MTINLLENIQLNVSKKLTKEQAEIFSLFPYKENEEKVFMYTYKDIQQKHKDILNFIYKKQIETTFLEEEKVEALIKKFLDLKLEGFEDEIFNEAIELTASDIHFEPHKDGVDVRFRINGALVLRHKLTLEEYMQVLSRIKINAGMDIAEKRKPQDGKTIIIHNNSQYNCRLSSVPVVYGEKIVLRILYSNKFLRPINSLSFSNNQLKVLEKITKIKNGLVLITGPTGSGKSTTLYTILNEIKRGDINISTLEDPIEVTMEGINQVNLNHKIGLTFAEGLRSLLRQDPNVIMVGEIRDEETAKMAVRSSITGHKVYSTIHTKSPREVYFRLEEMGVKNYLIKDALVGIISQRLIKTLCTCKVKVGEKDIRGIRTNLYKKEGCLKCNNSGYGGRKLVASVFYINKEIRRALKDIHNDEDLLSNKQMLEALDDSLYKGEIDYFDYLNILESEEL